MKLVKADQDRHVQIPGLPGPTRRPVDIDPSHTCFTNLRSLRIYRFDAGGEVNGHAEEDEVFVLVLAGKVEFTVNDQEPAFTLSSPDQDPGQDQVPCLAYLPPRASYRLIPKSDADVAYARATPGGAGSPVAIFHSHVPAECSGFATMLEETSHAERLRLRLSRIHAAAVSPIPESEADLEALVHVRATPSNDLGDISISNGEIIRLHEWDTVAVSPGERLTLVVGKHSSALVLTVLAT